MDLLHKDRVAQAASDVTTDGGGEMGKIEFDGNRELMSWIAEAVQKLGQPVALVFDGTGYRVELEDNALVLYQLGADGEHLDPPFVAGMVRLTPEAL